jgi:hypothetical protein
MDKRYKVDLSGKDYPEHRPVSIGFTAPSRKRVKIVISEVTPSTP